jgi:tetratricopeptide (TPR) repeat protein
MVSVRNLLFSLAITACASFLCGQQTGSNLLEKPSLPATETKAAQQPTPTLTPEKRGDIYMARKMYREAIDAYGEAAQNSAVIWNKMGIAYHQLSQLDAAKKNYEKAIKLNPHYAEAINNLGTVWYAKKSYRRAISQYNKALKYSPESASIYSNLGTALFARKKYQDAFVAYTKALSLDPEVFEHRNTYGVLLQERRVEDRAKFHFYLSKLYAKAKMNDRALEYMRKALEEGFKDRKKFTEDPDFASLQDLPEFQTLLTMEPRVL